MKSNECFYGISFCREAKNEMMENEQTMMMMNNQGTTQNEDHYDTPN